jgi:6-phosphogluconolactonase
MRLRSLPRSMANLSTGMTCSCSGWAPTGIPRRSFRAPRRFASRFRRVVANFVPKFESWRLTMTLPLLNQARQVLVSRCKRQGSRAPRTRIGRDAELPASRVNPLNGQLTWMIGERA